MNARSIPPTTWQVLLCCPILGGGGGGLPHSWPGGYPIPGWGWHPILSWLGVPHPQLVEVCPPVIGYPLPGTEAPPRMDLGPLTGVPSVKDMEPVEELWDRDGVPSPPHPPPPPPGWWTDWKHSLRTRAVISEYLIFYSCRRHLDGFDFENPEERVLRSGNYKTKVPAIRGKVSK